MEQEQGQFWTSSDLIDDEAILHYRLVGEVEGEDVGRPLAVNVTQMEDLDSGTGSSPAKVLVDGHRVSAEGARRLGSYLISAGDLADVVTAGGPPK